MKTTRYFATLVLLLAGTIFGMAQTNTLTIPDVTVAAGKTVMMPVNVDNTTDVVAVEFTITMPSGITLTPASAALSERANGHSVTMRKLSNGSYKAMISCAQNNAIIGRTGKLMEVPLTASSTLADGAEYDMTLADVVIVRKDGTDVTTGYTAGKVKLAQSPDFEVSGVTASPASLTPGGQISVSWTVSNIGGQSSKAGWNEQIYLEQGTTSKLIGTVYHNDVLSNGATESRNTVITLPTILGLDGAVNMRVKLNANSGSGEGEGLKTNNEATSAQTVSLGKLITLSSDTIRTEESDNKNLQIMLSRSGSTTADETFTITSTTDSRLTVPTTVTIPAGQSSVYFYAKVTANKALDPEGVDVIKVSGTGYTDVKTVIDIEDDTYPDLTLAAASSDVTEGGNVTLTITAQRAPSKDLALSLTCDQTSRFIIPTDIVLPKGQTSVQVTIPTVDDELPQNVTSVEFKVTAPKYKAASALVVLTDNDLPVLEMTLSPTEVSEADGPQCISVTLRRLTNANKKVTIKFSDDSNGRIYYGSYQSITMNAGVDQANLKFGVIDNTTVDGQKTYNITAAVYISSCSCNANTGTSTGTVTSSVTVDDNDGPTLRLTSTTSVLQEGKTMKVTLERNTDTTKAMTVAIALDHTENMQCPSQVTIPAGSSTTTFDVVSLSNQSTGDSFNAVISATLDGYSTGRLYFTVSDQTLPDAQITAFSVSQTEVSVGQTIDVNLTVSNTGSYQLAEMTPVNIYRTGTSSAVATMYLATALPAGSSVDYTQTITMPSTIGTYQLYASVNENQKTQELSYNNNSTKTISVKVVSPFTITVKSDKALYSRGETATITGTVTGTGNANQEIELYIINAGNRQVKSVTTDNSGTFSTTYTPYSEQIGKFAIGACYPGEGLSTEMAKFDITGLQLTSNTAVTASMKLDEQYNGSFQIKNPCSFAQTGLQVAIGTKPETCTATIDCPTTIAAGATISIPFSLLSSAISEGSNWETIPLTITSTEGSSLEQAILYYCQSQRGKLKLSETSIRTTMTKGKSRDYTLQLLNIGKGETGRITVSLPSWMQSVTPTEMASLEPGESCNLILRFTPTDDMQLNVPRTGNIGINCTIADGVTIPYSIEPVSEETGTLTLDVCDEYTYYTDEKPHLSGAEVVVTHPTTGAEIMRGTTGTNGIWSATLAEGYYTVKVTANKHESYSATILISPGEEEKRTINLSLQTVTVNWNVVETTTEDEYDIETNVTYETNVPAPVVVTTLPESIPASDLKANESLIFYVALTNKGLINAEDVTFTLPEMSGLTFEKLDNAASCTLAPQQSVTIPVRLTRLAAESSSARRNAGEVLPEDNPDPSKFECYAQFQTAYTYKCGTDHKYHYYPTGAKLGPCPKESSSTGGDGGGTEVLPIDWEAWEAMGGKVKIPNIPVPSFPSIVGPGDKETTTGISETQEDTGCTPCLSDRLTEMAGCAMDLFPVTRAIHTAYDVIKAIPDVYDAVKDFAKELSANDAAKAYINAALSPFGMLTVAHPFVDGQAKLSKGLANKKSNEELKALAKTTVGATVEIITNDEVVGAIPEISQVVGVSEKAQTILDRGCGAIGLGLDTWSLGKHAYGTIKSATEITPGDQESIYKFSAASYNTISDIQGLAEDVSDFLKGEMEKGSALGKKIANSEKNMTYFRRLGRFARVAGKFCGVVDAIKCAKDLFLYECPYGGSSKSRMLSNTSDSDIPEPESTGFSEMDKFLQDCYPLVSMAQAQDNITSRLFDDEAWQHVPEIQLYSMFYYLQQQTEPDYTIGRYFVKPTSISFEQYDAFLARWNNLYYGTGSDLTQEEIDATQKDVDAIRSAMDYLKASNYSDFREMLTDDYENLTAKAEQSSVCASITIKLSQTMVMTRQAFRGTLTVFNGSQDTQMKDVRLNLQITDSEGNVATSHEFQTNPENLTGFQGNLELPGGWTLEANSTGTVNVLFIPTKYAAPESDQLYNFGGTLSYIDPYTGLEVTRTLTPITLTVKPSPNLELTYFMQRDIKGDDPLTEAIEPSEEAEFSLLINNKGYGDATNVRMTTQQPEIVDNEKGLAIDFTLVSSQLNGGDKSLALGGSVATDFGNIAAQSTAYAQWWLKSNRLGHFTKYNVKATHVTSYDNPDLTLLDTVTIHELVRSISISDDATASIGFMTNDITDAEDMPDMLYLNNGLVESVGRSTVSIAKVSDTMYRLTVTPSAAGWSYGNVLDPTYGVSELKSIVRESDQKEMPLRNFWQTDRTLRDGKDPLYENRIHCVDDFSSVATETYLLTFDPTPDLLLSVASIDGVPADNTVASEPVANVKVVFNKAVDPATFNADDITFTVQGVKQDATKIGITTEDNKTFTLDFTEINETSANGYYVLQVQTADVTDVDGFKGKDGKSAGWIMFRGGLIQFTNSVYPENSGEISYQEKTSSARALAGSAVSTGNLNYGSTYQFSATPKTGYQFASWTVNGETVSNEPTFEYTVLGDVTLVSNFTPSPHTVTIDDNISGGSITGLSTGIYEHGTTATLTATAESDSYTFSNWTVNGENAGTYATLEITINQDMTISAVFGRDIDQQITTVGKVLTITGDADTEFMNLFNSRYASDQTICAVDLTGVTTMDKNTTIATGNPNVVYYLQPYQRLQNTSNVVTSGVCDSYQLTDNYPVFIPTEFTATSAAYTRNVSQAGWYSLLLPYAVEAASDDSFRAEKFVSIDTEASTVSFEKVDQIEANMPYIFNLSGTTRNFSAENVTVPVTPDCLSDGDFCGTLTLLPEGSITGCYALRNDGTGFGLSGATSYVTPFRAYIRTSAGNARILRIVHMDDDVTTDINAVGAGTQGTPVYNIQGQKVSTSASKPLKQGLYIIGGQKAVVR